MYLLSVSEDIFLLVCGVGILQGILLTVLVFFHPKGDKSVNLFLALYMCCTTIIMSLPLIIQLIGWQNNYVPLSVAFLSGPLLYLYIRSFKEVIGWRKAWPHLVPFFVFVLLSYWNLSSFAAKYPNSTQLPDEILKSPGTLLITFAKPAQQILYYFLARKELLLYQRSIRHIFSETSRIDLGWANFLVNGYLVLVVTFLLIFPLILNYPQHFNLLLLINMAVATPYMYIITYKGITQPTIWQIESGVNKEKVEEEILEAEEAATEKTHAKKAKPADGKIQETMNRILLLMVEEKLYQEAELTLHQLAERLQIPNYQVSQALNEGLKKNFYDLINGYRVEEAKRLLLDEKSRNYTILSIGFEAGFNSKTTFNTVFKKFTGLTPTEFRDKQQA